MDNQYIHKQVSKQSPWDLVGRSYHNLISITQRFKVKAHSFQLIKILKKRKEYQIQERVQSHLL